MRLQAKMVQLTLLVGGLLVGQAVSQTVAAAPDADDPNAVERGVARLLPEGFRVEDRDVRLVRHPEQVRWFVTFVRDVAGAEAVGRSAAQVAREFDPRPDDPLSRPIEVLPCDWLDKMIKFSGDQTDLSIVFRVRGEITTYQGHNFILLTRAAAVSLFGQGSAAPRQERPRAADMSLDAVFRQLERSEQQQRSADADMESETPAEVVHEALRAALLAIPRARPLELSGGEAFLADERDAENRGAPNGVVTGSAGAGAIWKDGHMIIDRVGRLAWDPDEQRWLFVFESDGRGGSEPPVVVHPSRLLEVMEQAALETSRTLRFRVSGTVSLFRGTNYLLLRKALLVADSSNFVR